ncbi:hypothetical protein A3N99_02920 [Mycobacteroides abscessus]|uniref:hypothetical protein n=1 Tax=Mycobacteroides abscessus TaxID=36809 RepID=UPI00078E339C|nr:hypothetical protein [Mycobacteroides abscessus]AMU39258.1 hypothetical protein A3N99_02920 [Mycobacteroides abscessus]
MAALTYFTAKLTYKAIVADGEDVDTNPDTKGIYAGVTVRASAKGRPVFIPAPSLTPDPALIVLAPIRCYVDDGVLGYRPTRPSNEPPALLQPLRLVAKSAVLDLPVDVPLVYEFEFYGVTFDGQKQTGGLPTLRVAAPATDITVDLADPANHLPPQ